MPSPVGEQHQLEEKERTEFFIETAALLNKRLPGNSLHDGELSAEAEGEQHQEEEDGPERRDRQQTTE